MRIYKVLRVTGERTYELVAEIEAGSPEVANRAAGTEHGDGQYVAVPERSWGESPPGRLVSRFVFDSGDPEAPEPVVPDDEPEPDDDEPESDEQDEPDGQEPLDAFQARKAELSARRKPADTPDGDADSAA